MAPLPIVSLLSTSVLVHLRYCQGAAFSASYHSSGLTARFLSGVPHPHLLGVCHPDVFLFPTVCKEPSHTVFFHYLSVCHQGSEHLPPIYLCVADGCVRI